MVIYAPEGNIYGNRVAAPVFKEIADKIYTSDYDMQRKEFNLAKLEDTRSVPFTRIGNRAVVDRILSRLHVEVITEEQSNTTWVQTRPTEDHKKLYVDSYTPIHGTIPNVKGMGLKDALYVLRSLDIAVKVVGHGVVKKQSIPPDTQIKKGMSITIELG